MVICKGGKQPEASDQKEQHPGRKLRQKLQEKSGMTKQVAGGAASSGGSVKLTGSIRDAVSRVPKTVALVAGLLVGPLFFLIVEPALYGGRPVPLFDREPSIFFLFKLFPFVIAPSVCLFVAALGPASRGQAFRLGGIFAISLLLPVPLLDEWRTIPSQYGLAASSRAVFVEVALLVGALVLFATIAAGIAGLVSPLMYRHFPRRTIRR